MTAPLGSVTVPEILPPVADRSGRAANRRMTMARVDRRAIKLVTGEIDFEATTCISLIGAAGHKGLVKGDIRSFVAASASQASCSVTVLKIVLPGCPKPLILDRCEACQGFPPE